MISFEEYNILHDKFIKDEREIYRQLRETVNIDELSNPNLTVDEKYDMLLDKFSKSLEFFKQSNDHVYDYLDMHNKIVIDFYKYKHEKETEENDNE